MCSPRKRYHTASASHLGAPNNLELRPDVFEAAVSVVTDDLDPPSDRVDVNKNWSPFDDTLHRGTKLIRFPWLDLWPMLLSVLWQIFMLACSPSVQNTQPREA